MARVGGVQLGGKSMRLSIAGIAASLFVLNVTTAAFAAPGDLDPSFGASGVATVTDDAFIGPYYGMAIQPDGKIVVSGAAVIPYSSSAPYLVRFTSDGSLDTSFGSGGFVLVDPWGMYPLDLAIESNGKILTANMGTVLRYSADGVLETTFASDRLVCSFYGPCVYVLALQPDGKIVAATQGGLVRYHADGSYDAGFGDAGVAPSSLPYAAMALQSDGKIVVAGGNSGIIVVRRYDGAGNLDPTFATSGVIVISRANNFGPAGLAIQADGKLLLLSTERNVATPGSRTVLMRFDVDGTWDAGFGAGGVVERPLGSDGYTTALSLQDDGKIVVAGHASGGFVARYDADGSADADFGAGGVVLTGRISSADALSIAVDGKILVAGWGHNGTDSGATVARFMADDSPLLNTPAGSNIHVALGGAIDVTFAAVSTTGTTAVTTSSTGPVPPAGFQTGNPPLFYDVTTTAAYAAPVTVCIGYDPADYGDPNLAQLFHYESGAWTDVTTTNDTVNYVICGSSSSLSPFAIMTRPPAVAHVQQPINADGSSVFTANRGVVPVKFTLAAGGQSTCSLPTATIAVFRTGGAVDQPISESVYALAADEGWFFRITGCQYLYNLNAKALGRGSYVVQILIDNAVVGSARLGLR
jgi:uncharacterized delta-60 repeat protein